MTLETSSFVALADLLLVGEDGAEVHFGADLLGDDVVLLAAADDPELVIYFAARSISLIVRLEISQMS